MMFCSSFSSSCAVRPLLCSSARRRQCSIRAPLGKMVCEDLTLSAAEQAALPKTWMSKHRKAFVAANIVAGAVVGAGMQIEQDTRDSTAIYKRDRARAAERAVDAGIVHAICMAGVAVVGVHLPGLWAALIAATFVPTWARVAVDAIALPIVNAVHDARHKKRSG